MWCVAGDGPLQSHATFISRSFQSRRVGGFRIRLGLRIALYYEVFLGSKNFKGLQGSPRARMVLF